MLKETCRVSGARSVKVCSRTPSGLFTKTPVTTSCFVSEVTYFASDRRTLEEAAFSAEFVCQWNLQTFLAEDFESAGEGLCSVDIARVTVVCALVLLLRHFQVEYCPALLIRHSQVAEDSEREGGIYSLS